MSRTGLFDSHAHMDSDYFTDDRDALLTQLQEELDGIINPGCDEITSGFAVSLAEKYDFMYAAVGWHPEDLEGILDNSYLDELAAWAVHPKVVAIGEIGLDYYWKGNEPKDVQKRRLLEQLDLAKQFDLPVIIHDRDAHGDILEIFQKEVTGVRAVFHCYSGSLEMAKELLKRGFYLGFGGTSTYKNAAKVREVLQYVPDDLLLFETDSPYLTPVPYRGKRNQPGYTELVARNAPKCAARPLKRWQRRLLKMSKLLFNKIKLKYKLPVCFSQTGSLYFKAVIFQKSKQVSVSTVVFTFLFFVQKLMCA